MDLDESRKVLNFDKEDEVTSEILSERYWDYQHRNSEEKGGSPYLRAKIDNAKDTLIHEYRVRLLEKQEEEKEGEKEAKNKDTGEEEKPAEKPEDTEKHVDKE